MSLALEGAWARIAGGLSDRKMEIQHTRRKLAQTILAIAADGVGTAKQMQDEAIKRIGFHGAAPCRRAKVHAFSLSLRPTAFCPSEPKMRDDPVANAHASR